MNSELDLQPTSPKKPFGVPDGYVIHEGIAAMDFVRVTEFLSSSYWSPGIAQETVERGARNSAVVIGVFTDDGRQVGYGRVVSDCTRFAYLADIFVDEAHRGRGLARAMVGYALAHPDLATVRTWTLATQDAHGVYSALGFRPITDPESRPEAWMIKRKG